MHSCVTLVSNGDPRTRFPNIVRPYQPVPRPPGRRTSLGASFFGVSRGAECGGSTPYERLTLQLHHDRRWRQEVSLGKRVGLYRMRGDLGAGNFSNVKMAVHQLTSGKQATAKATACRLIPKSALLYLPYSSVLVALVGQHPSSLLCLRAPGG
ncbi:uncharacterized protein LOC127748808 isoform X2 [Frankliniella occidentalis]|uniref:Uncharacterized protein LOC127748808 isoform X2 n=1 Tax=Frankliniella occidentalis TaxID=133901 RepID=A0A9C6TZ82_FRAOC|nr:uncharacterized protein LOC127748808 isoform X2 [Frankliniella occidentalis]